MQRFAIERNEPNSVINLKNYWLMFRQQSYRPETKWDYLVVRELAEVGWPDQQFVSTNPLIPVSEYGPVQWWYAQGTQSNSRPSTGCLI